MKSEKSVEISKATLRLIWRLAQNIFPFHAALCAKLWVESGQLINWFLGCWDSRGRVLVVPFQKLSLKGILVKFCPIFSAFSVLIVKWESQYRVTNLKDVWLTLTFFFFKNQTVKPQAYLWGVHGGEVSLCPMEFPHTCYRCSLELH